jgi:hypothetical protein
VFLKAANRWSGTVASARRPADANFMHYECGLAVVIRREGKRIRRASSGHVSGYGGQRLRHTQFPRAVLPSQPASEKPRRLHRAGPWLVPAGEVRTHEPAPHRT